jgi:hypothetical protein
LLPLALGAHEIGSIADGVCTLSFFPAELFAQARIHARAQQALLHQDNMGELSRVS